MKSEEIAAAYSAAAEHIDHRMLAHRDYFGGRTAAMAELQTGEYVLDVCCGAGGSALPAARAVGRNGRVIGVDIAEAALNRGRERAAAEGLTNVEFRKADFSQVYFRAASFDAVLSVFGVFFLEDMAGAVTKMWRYLRPGGRLVLTTRGKAVFEPGNTLFWDAVRRVRPELYGTFTPWLRLSTPELIRDLFAQAGVAEVAVEGEDHPHELGSGEDFWTLVMGTGYRAVVEQLTDAEREDVRAACLTLETRVLSSPALYAVARKPCPM